jgi:hypothetical protein
MHFDCFLACLSVHIHQVQVLCIREATGSLIWLTLNTYSLDAIYFIILFLTFHVFEVVDVKQSNYTA